MPASRAAGAALLVTAGAAAAVAAVALHWPAPARPSDPACDVAARLVQAMDLTTLGDQVALRARAAELSDVLLSVSGVDAAADQARATGTRIAQVLGDPSATVGDLEAAVGPVTGKCGLGAPPPD